MEFINGISLDNIEIREHPQLIQNLAEGIHTFAYKSSTRLSRTSESRNTSSVSVL
jgi:hypothetical protein